MPRANGAHSLLQCAAAASLWLEFHAEQLTQLYPQPWQRVEAFRRCLLESARPFRDPPRQRVFGAGVLDTLALLKRPLPDPATLVRAK